MQGFCERIGWASYRESGHQGFLPSSAREDGDEGFLFQMTDRPKVSQILAELSFLSLKAHYLSVMEIFNDNLEENPEISMKIWFERERLRAFGDILQLSGLQENNRATTLDSSQEEKSFKILKRLCERLRNSGQFASSTLKNVASRATTSFVKNQVGTSEGDKQSYEISARDVAFDIQGDVQELWDLLPPAQIKKVEGIWVKSMLNLNRIDQLANLERWSEF